MSPLKPAALMCGLLFTGLSAANERCAVLYQTAEGHMETEVLDSLSVERLAPEDPFVLPAETPGAVKAISCGRTELALGPNDHKPLLAGFVLYVVTDDRLGALEVIDGQLQFRMVEGEMSETESLQISEALNVAQPYFYRE